MYLTVFENDCFALGQKSTILSKDSLKIGSFEKCDFCEVRFSKFQRLGTILTCTQHIFSGGLGPNKDYR